MNNKQIGNKHFRDGEYEKAIDCYQEYLKQRHADNKNAYFNLGQCYFRLKKYQQCANACEQALRIDPMYVKAAYRRMHAYKQLNDAYRVFISAAWFFSHGGHAESMKEKEEVSKIMEEARLALLNRQECVQREDGFHKEEQNHKTIQNPWQIGLEKWSFFIKEVLEGDYQLGVSSAYYILNNLEDGPQKIKYTDELIGAKKMRLHITDNQKRSQENFKVQTNCPVKTPQQNLFADSDDSAQSQEQVPQVTLPSQPNRYLHLVHPDAQQQEVKSSSQTNSKQVEKAYSYYFCEQKSTKDIYDTQLVNLIAMVQSPLKKDQKDQILTLFRTRNSNKFRLLFKSMSKNQKNKLFMVLKEQDLSEWIQHFLNSCK